MRLHIALLSCQPSLYCSSFAPKPYPLNIVIVTYYVIGAGAGRAAHEAAESVRQEGHQAKSAVKQAGEALEDGFVAAVQAPRHLAFTLKRQLTVPP